MCKRVCDFGEQHVFRKKRGQGKEIQTVSRFLGIHILQMKKILALGSLQASAVSDLKNVLNTLQIG